MGSRLDTIDPLGARSGERKNGAAHSRRVLPLRPFIDANDVSLGLLLCSDVAEFACDAVGGWHEIELHFLSVPPE